VASRDDILAAGVVKASAFAALAQIESTRVNSGRVK
jgi:hypothetical protein